MSPSPCRLEEAENRLRRSSASGFTLVEVAVAASLFGLLAVILFGGLRFGIRVMDTASQRSDFSAQLAATYDFVRNELGQAQPMLTASRAEVLAFDGRPDGVDFVTLLPAHIARGGYQVLSIGVARSQQNQRLQAQWKPFDRIGLPSPQDEAPHESLLVDDVTVAEFAYFGGGDPSSPASWHASWQGHRTLPSLVRIRLQQRGQAAVHEMTVALRLAETSS